MTQKSDVFKATFRRILGVVLVLSIGFVFSCDNGDDEPDPETWTWPGIYVFNKAILTSGAAEIADTLNIPEILIPTDITEYMAGGLLAAAECANPANGAVELKSDFKLFFTCLTESNESQAGTWEYNDSSKELDLNMASPPLPAALQLKVQNVTTDLDTKIVAGTIENFPLTKDLLGGFLASLPAEQRDAILAGIPDNYVQLINVDIEFLKVE
jgi:hypothetical protein